jgi:AcrR family transcriptional regulator
MPRTGLTASEIKEKAIDATMAKMRENGFDKVRLTDIAKELGLSHAALYSHFKDKTALFDSVSERWLHEINKSLEAVCRETQEPTEKILSWMLTLHRAKLAKVLHDPELYKAFDLSMAVEKPFARQHMETIHAQLVGLIKEVIAARSLRGADPETMADVVQESLMAFHHPRLVAEYVHENREPLLRLVLESVLKGLNLKS